MRWRLSKTGLLCLIALFSLSIVLPGRAAEADDAESELPYLKKKKKKIKFEDDYRYDWAERHLTLGMNFGGALAAGNTLNAFPYGGTVTPYFKGAFGDGNALQLDITVGALPILDGSKITWLFFRTPILPGSATEGFLGFIAPNVQFRYELDLGSSISKRSPFLFWGGIGLGSMITYGEAKLTSNGTEGLRNRDLQATEIFFDFVPTGGMKLRLGEFGYMELGVRQHLLVPFMSKIKDVGAGTDTGWQKFMPSVIPEFWIGTGRVIDVFLGFSYDFK